MRSRRFSQASHSSKERVSRCCCESSSGEGAIRDVRRRRARLQLQLGKRFVGKWVVLLVPGSWLRRCLWFGLMED